MRVSFAAHLCRPCRSSAVKAINSNHAATSLRSYRDVRHSATATCASPAGIPREVGHTLWFPR